MQSTNSPLLMSQHKLASVQGSYNLQPQQLAEFETDDGFNSMVVL